MSNEQVCLVGAASDCDLIIDAPTVSGRHCEITRTAREILLKDLQSTNGTFVNERRITSVVAVSPGDYITLGQAVELPWGRIQNALDRLAPPRPPVSPLVSPPVPLPGPGRSAGARTKQIASMGLAVIVLGLLGIGLVKFGGRGQPTPAVADTKSQETASAGELPSVGAGSGAPEGGDSRVPDPTAVDSPSAEKTVPANAREQSEFGEGSVGWLGCRLRDFAFPHGTGWVVRPNVVVTTGAIAADLMPFVDQGFEIIVCVRGQIFPVKSVHLHPDFDPEAPGSPSGMHANLGLLLLAESKLQPGRLADEQDQAGIAAHPTVMALGYHSELGANEPFDELKVRLRRSSAEIVKSEFRASTASRIYRVRTEVSPCMEGAPVVTAGGHVIGTLAGSPQDPYLVALDQLSRLLKIVEGL